MPWLYYNANDGELITKDTNIPTEYAKGNTLTHFYFTEIQALSDAKADFLSSTISYSC